MNKYWLLLYLVLVIGCTATKSNIDNSQNNVMETISKNKFKKNYVFKPNESNTHTLVIKRFKHFEDLFMSTKFFVYDNESQIIILEDTLYQGTVDWISDNKIFARSVEHIPNRLTKQHRKYYYNVITKEKRSLED